MIYSQLGKTGINVSRLGMGTMRLPFDKNNPDLENSINLIEYAMIKGINFFDVGTFYCQNNAEKIFGEAIKRNLNIKIISSGKNTTHQQAAKEWSRQLKNTLGFFRLQSLDTYFIHYLDYEIWLKYFIENNVIEQIIEAKLSGLLKYLGFSSHDSPENIVKLIDSSYFDAVILSYNLLNREYEEVIKYADEKGVGVIIMNPLAGGLLVQNHIISESLLNLIPGSSLNEIALNYVYSNKYVSCVLSGMRNTDEIDNNINVLTKWHRFSTDEIEFINSILENERNKNSIYCTKCDYCKPCTQGIDIPSVIAIMNKYFFNSSKPFFIRDYSLLEYPASCCIGCGVCESRCPNKLPLTAIMAKASSIFIE
jgi:uncharacterized protein